MKERILSIFITLTAIGGVSAQNYIMQVHKADGTLTEFDANDVTQVTFKLNPLQTFSIPSGTDLYTYLTENRYLIETYEHVTLSLKSGGEYTQSGYIEIPAGHNVTLAGSEGPYAKITFTGDAGYTVSDGFTLEHVTIDATKSAGDLISLSLTPDKSLLGATGNGDYYNIMDEININNAKILNLNSRIISDNGQKYCVETMNISNTMIKLNTSEGSGMDESALLCFDKGFINSLYITATTIWGAGTSAPKYLVSYGNNAKCDRVGYIQNTVSITHSTFYKAIRQDGRIGTYPGFAGRETSNWILTENIFVDSSRNIARFFMGGRTGSSKKTFRNNTYQYRDNDGNPAWDSPESYDDSGTDIKSNPGFRSPDNGLFAPYKSSEQYRRRTGDPYWLSSMWESPANRMSP